jgi:hypothetical protein
LVVKWSAPPWTPSGFRGIIQKTESINSAVFFPLNIGFIQS